MPIENTFKTNISEGIDEIKKRIEGGTLKIYEDFNNVQKEFIRISIDDLEKLIDERIRIAFKKEELEEKWLINPYEKNLRLIK